MLGVVLTGREMRHDPCRLFPYQKRRAKRRELLCPYCSMAAGRIWNGVVRRNGRLSSGVELIPISNASALGEVRSGCHSSQTHTAIGYRLPEQHVRSRVISDKQGHPCANRMGLSDSTLDFLQLVRWGSGQPMAEMKQRQRRIAPHLEATF